MAKLTTPSFLRLAWICVVAGPSPGFAKIAAWRGLRGAILQNELLLDGGAMTSGTWGGSSFDNATLVPPDLGTRWSIDLCTSFNVSGDTQQLLKATLPSPDPSYPGWLGGGLISNGFDFYTFG